MSDLDGSVVLVVGASGGLGSRIARQLEVHGATVVRSGRGANAEAVIDFRARTDLAQTFHTIATAHGRLDGVIVAAGLVAFGAITELRDDTVSELFEVNTLGPIRLIRDAVPLLAESAAAGRQPFIVTISGIVSEAPTAGLAAYSASKSAVAAFATAAARELRRSGIRVLDARPGHTETGLSTHPIAGVSPAFPRGFDPEAVAARIVRAIVDDEKDLPSTAF